MTKRLLLLLFLISSFSVRASHLAGGEISYQCLGNGMYKFRVTIFRDCSGISFSQANITLMGPVSVTCPLVASYDITSNISCGTVACSPPATFNSQKGGISKFVYEGTANLSSLGAAPVGGYTWTTSNLPCCRNASNNSNCNGDMILRVKMYGFQAQNGVMLTPAQLCDNSPVFLEDPNLVLVASPSDTAVFNGFGEDVDQTDQIRYYFDHPWNAVGVSCNFTGSYSLNAPMPGILGGGLDSTTGVVRFNPSLVGAYNMAFRVASFRQGQLISEVFRDFQAMIISSPPNAPLPYNPAYTPGSLQYQQQQQSPIIRGNIVHPVTGQPDRVIVLYPGDTLRADYTVKDSFPVLPTPNRIYSYVRSEVLGAQGTNQLAGCDEPPCAIIQNRTTSAPVVQVNLRSRQQGYGLIADTAGWDINGRIFWTPQAVHAQISGVPAVRKYYFGVFAFDDVCPVTGTAAEFFEVNVFPAVTRLTAPATLCLEPQGQSDLLISWKSTIDSVSLEVGDSLVAGLTRAERLQRSITRRRASFLKTEVYRVNLADSSTRLLSSITNVDQLSYLDQAVPADSLFAYYLRVVSALDTQWVSVSLPALRVQPAVTGDRSSMQYQLNWQSPFPTASSAFNGWYYIFSRNLSLQSPWLLVDSIQHQTQFSSALQLSNDTLAFRIGWKASTTCELSYSQQVTAVFDQTLGIPTHMQQIRLYPNPVQDKLRLDLEGAASPQAWRIYDMQGRLVKQAQWQNEWLDVSFLEPAMYRLVLDFPENKSISLGFSKQK